MMNIHFLINCYKSLFQVQLLLLVFSSVLNCAPEGGSANNGTDTGGSTGEPEKKPGLSKSVVALIVVGLALIACLGVGLWFFYERKRARVNTGPLAGQEQRP